MLQLQPSPPSFVEVRRRFGFRSIEIGRWVTRAERDRAAEQFYQALVDLMQTLRVPEAVISLRGQLGLQYGIGGQPGVAAHYIPATRQLALAKNAGAGSLAHEWFHGFDHYMGDKAYTPELQATRYPFASTGWAKHFTPVEHRLNELLQNAFRTIALNDDETDSPLVVNSRKADQQHGIRYYALPEELCARAFEAFVEDCGPTNRFLVRGTRFSDDAKAGLYPQGEHRQRINDAFSRYFQALGFAIAREQLRQQAG